MMIGRPRRDAEPYFTTFNTGFALGDGVVEQEVEVEVAELARRRAEQARRWLWNEISESLIDALRADPGVKARLPALEKDVAAGKTAPGAAAAELLALFRTAGRK